MTAALSFDPPIKLLVVEDHLALLEVMVETLAASGHEVVGIDSAEGLDQLPAHFVAEIAVLDLNLPGENGLSLAQRLRGIQPDIGISSIRWPACCTPPKANWCSTAMSPPCCTPWRWPLTTL